MGVRVIMAVTVIMGMIAIVGVVVIVVVIVGVTTTGLVAALNVVMVGFLRQPDFRFEAQYLFPVLTVQAVHDVLPGHALLHPILEGVEHQIVVVKITGFNEL